MASAPAHGERGRDHIHDHEAGADRLPEQKGARLASRRRPHDLGPAVVLAGPEIKAPLEGLVVTLLEALVVLSYPPPEHHPPGACSAGGTATVSACSSMQAATFRSWRACFGGDIGRCACDRARPLPRNRPCQPLDLSNILLEASQKPRVSGFGASAWTAPSDAAPAVVKRLEVSTS